MKRWYIAVIILLLAGWAYSCRAETVTARCNGAPPCLSWSFDLPSTPTLSPALYITAFDADSDSEGTLTINGHVVPLFGPEASPLNNLVVRTIGVSTDASWWQTGSGNLGVIVWTRDPANDPLKHEVRALSLQYAPAVIGEWKGPVIYMQSRSNRLLYGFCRTDISLHTAFAIKYTAAVDVRMRAIFANYRAGQDIRLDLSEVIRLPIQAGDGALLWTPPLPAGCL